MIEIDLEKDPKPASRDEKIFLTIFFGLVLACFCGAIIEDYRPIKLSALFFVLAWWPLLFLHELGHALVARALGWRVEKFVIGWGKVLKEFTFAGAKCEFRMFPITGFVLPRPRDVSHARLKQGLIYFAGPGIELALFFVIWLIVGPGSFMAPTTNYFDIFLKGVGLAAVFGAVTNLLPVGARTSSGIQPSDGLGIFLCIVTPKKEFERHIRWRMRDDDE